MHALLKTNVGDEICCVESPLIVSRLRIELENAGAGMGVLGSISPRLDHHASHGVHIDSRTVISASRIVDFKAIK